MNKEHIIEKVINDICEQREEILRAFMAKYNIQPDECEQVICSNINETVWYVRRKNEFTKTS